NVCLVRPIFSPTDFIQIKGRGTRTYNFRSPDGSQVKPKENFKLFDFFANCEYFEEKYPYDEVIKLPPAKKATEMMVREAEAAYGEAKLSDDFVSERGDQMLDIATYQYGSEGMRIDREMYQRFESQVKESYAAHPEFKQAVDSGDYERMEQFVKENLFNKPTDYIDMDKLRQSYHADRRLSLWEILDKVFGRIPHFKSKNDLAKEEFDRYIVADQVSPVTFYEVKEFFKMYLADEEARAHINKDDYNYFAAAPEEMAIMQTLGKERIDRIKSYVHDNVNLNQFN
ncbi:restriction endonuclease subunit R, partial [Patescibacteria group bacterium]|nr:restriction endonuclease subunit R [Patescibacteria group bacterium]